MTFVVTLVHGTIPFRRLTRLLSWRPRHRAEDTPAWVFSDSPLCAALAKDLPGEVVLSVFGWWGANSVHGRWRAAADLRRHLEEQMARYPAARHFVIAHSHGGNVALHAVQSDVIKQHLAGVVCLSTPFIVVVDRAGWLTPIYVAHLYLAGVLGASALAAVWLRTGNLTSLLHWSPLAYTAVLPIASAAAFATLWLVSLVNGAAGSWKRRIELPDLTWLGRDRLLIIKGLGDEANSLLAAAQLVVWGAGAMIRRIAGLVGSFHHRLERPFRDSSVGVVKHAGTAVMAGVFMILATLSGTTLAPVMALVTLASFATWGARLGALSPFIEVAAESTPPGTWQITQLAGHQSGSWIDIFGTELTGLSHSSVYTDWRAITAIVEWMTAHGGAITPAAGELDGQNASR